MQCFAGSGLILRVFTSSTFVALVVVLGCLSQKLSAELILPANEATHLAMGANADYAWALFGITAQGQSEFRGTVNGTTLNGKTFYSGVDHVTAPQYTSYGIMNTNNFNTNPTTLCQVVHYSHPTRDQAAFFTIDNPVGNFRTLEFYTGTVTAGMEGTTAGYGARLYLKQDPNTRTITGDRWGGADVITTLQGNRTFLTTFDLPFLPEARPFQTGLQPGSSGLSFTESNRYILGFGARALLNFNEYGFVSEFDIPDVPWFDKTVTAHYASVPEPSSLILLSNLALVAMYFRRRPSFTRLQK